MLPALTAIYGLRWDDIWRMPVGELREYLDQLDDFRKMHAGALGAEEARQGAEEAQQARRPRRR